MAHKCIVFVRVSTNKQDFDNQERELYEMAIADGYRESDIYCIAEKESGRKLSEEERAGLNRMKELIETDSTIDCLYAWEVSRIARRKKINFSILDYLQERKKQLIIKNPFIKLFNDDGTVNEGAEIVFTLFSQMAESEVRNREARFARTKKEYAKTMRYSGGPVKYGYQIVDGVYTVNEDEAEVIRFIYDYYNNQNAGYVKLWRECKERGMNITKNSIINILADTAYIGFAKKGQTHYERIYPVIINKDVFEKAQAIKSRKNETVIKTKVYWFGNKLIKCPECEGYYIAIKGSKVYQCLKHSLHNKDSERCQNKESISINYLDSILWHVAKHAESRYLGKQASDDRIQYLQQIETLKTKVDTANKHLNKEESNIEKIADNYVAGLYNREKRDLKIKETKENVNEINRKIISWNNDIQHITGLLNIIDGKLKLDLPIISGDSFRDKLMIEAVKSANIIDMVNEITDVKQMYDIVHRHIHNVTIEDSRCNGKMAKKIQIYPYSGIVLTFYFLYKIGKQPSDKSIKPKSQIYQEVLNDNGDTIIRLMDIDILKRL